MVVLVVALLALFSNGALGAIEGDLNCTVVDAGVFKWSPTATICEDTISSASCKVLYPEETDGEVPSPGEEFPRQFNCYSTDEGVTFSADMKKAAIDNCPKTCGFCCQTSAYNCRNVQFPRLTCSTITAAQCRSTQWRTIIAQDCPSACGFCNEGGCVDAVTDCGNDISICNAVGMQDFVNTYCQKTCQRCASSTTASSGSGTCTSYIADSSTACASWAANGFCTNTFYTAVQRRAYCATTCRLC